MATVNWNGEAFVKQGMDAIERAMKYISMDLWSNVAKEAPKDHGRLAGSFTAEKKTDFIWAVVSPVEYAMAVAEGTGIYGKSGKPITPKNAKALVFEINGQKIFTQSVKGQKANKYDERAVARTKGRVQSLIDRAAREVLG